jgi:hypothetical protein
MGIGVETSRLGRRVAELATGAVDDDARQYQDHAGDTEEVGRVLRAELVVRGMGSGHQMHDHVKHAGREDQQEPDTARRRESRTSRMIRRLLSIFSIRY